MINNLVQFHHAKNILDLEDVFARNNVLFNGLPLLMFEIRPFFNRLLGDFSLHLVELFGESNNLLAISFVARISHYGSYVTDFADFTLLVNVFAYVIYFGRAITPHLRKYSFIHLFYHFELVVNFFHFLHFFFWRQFVHFWNWPLVNLESAKVLSRFQKLLIEFFRRFNFLSGNLISTNIKEYFIELTGCAHFFVDA